MSNVIPKTIDKNAFDKIQKKLNNKKYSHHKNIITENYKRLRGMTEYNLKENLSEEILKKIDFVLKRIGFTELTTLCDIAEYLRMLTEEKKYIIIFAYNGTGKTRLSCEFKAIGQKLNEETGEKSADTLYYNAFTEDLFNWDNDLENDDNRKLIINSDSKFFNCIKEFEMENRIRPILQKYADFDFHITYDEIVEAEETIKSSPKDKQKRIESYVTFNRDIIEEGKRKKIDNIKISRGEENIFIWCFFLAIVQLVIDKEAVYDWVKYIYVDDPISSLDDNNVIAIASNLAQMMKKDDAKIIVSTHHTLFFNVLCNEIENAEQLFLQKKTNDEGYILKDTSKTPFFHHIALLKELKKAANSGKLYTYHFNILRNILEKTASFHGFAHFSSCIKRADDDEEGLIYKRIVDLMSHGNYSIFEPKEMVNENKEYFKKVLNTFLEKYSFNENLFEETQSEEE